MRAPLGSPAPWQLWTAATDGSNPRPAGSGGPFANGVDQLDWFAPKTIAVYGNFSLYLDRIDRGSKLLAASAGDEASRDARGDRFAVTQSRCGQNLCPSRIVVLDVAHGKRTTIGGPAARYYDPSLSPDGSRVAFISREGLEVARIDDVQETRRIAPLAACPYWSPDGHYIAYIGAHGSLRIIRPSGGRSIVLLDSGLPCGYAPFNVGWSPNGQSIAVIAPKGLLVIDVATRRIRRIAAFPSVAGFAWSPDSSQLLIAARPQRAACSSIWRTDADGTHPIRIAQC